MDTAARSKDVAAVVLRGVGHTITAGHDLTDGGEWDIPWGARLDRFPVAGPIDDRFRDLFRPLHRFPALPSRAPDIIARSTT